MPKEKKTPTIAELQGQGKKKHNTLPAASPSSLKSILRQRRIMKTQTKVCVGNPILQIQSPK
jgi:hypothetical protein